MTAGDFADMKADLELKPAFPAISTSLIVCCAGLSLLLLVLSILTFLSGHAYTGLKLMGGSLLSLGARFDPVNVLAGCGGSIVKPPRYARIFWILALIAFPLILLGWYG